MTFYETINIKGHTIFSKLSFFARIAQSAYPPFFIFKI